MSYLLSLHSLTPEEYDCARDRLVELIFTEDGTPEESERLRLIAECRAYERAPAVAECER